MAERLGMELSKVDISRYSDGEINIQILEEPRGKDVFLIQVNSNQIQINQINLIIYDKNYFQIYSQPAIQ